MTVPDVASSNKNAVSPFLKGFQNLMRTDSCGAQGADRPDVRGILKPTHAGQIGASIRAPVAEEADDEGLEHFFGHCFSPRSLSAEPVICGVKRAENTPRQH